MAEFEGEQAVMRARSGKGRWWRAGIDQQQRAFDGGALETAEIGCTERLALGFREVEHPVELRRNLLLAAMEQRQPAIAMAEETQHRRHAVEQGLDRASVV